MTLLPQILLSGMIFPLDSMAAGVRWIGYLLPLTYFTQISRGRPRPRARRSIRWPSRWSRSRSWARSSSGSRWSASGATSPRPEATRRSPWSRHDRPGRGHGARRGGATGARVAGQEPPADGWGLRDVTVLRAGGAWLDDVSLDARPGEVTAVVGGDGAGKTTLLRVLVGALPPTTGEVRRPSAREIGFVAARTGLYADLTVDENLCVRGRGLRGRPGRGCPRGPARCSPGWAWPTARDRLAGDLSGGMRQKLALAAAILHDPRLLVLDEPTTGVDPVSRAELWHLVAGVAAAGTAVVVATTYLDEAERATPWSCSSTRGGRSPPALPRRSWPGCPGRSAAPIDGPPTATARPGGAAAPGASGHPAGGCPRASSRSSRTSRTPRSSPSWRARREVGG